MSDFIPMKNKSVSSFDVLPNEILLHIFDYLISNDIIYSFIDCNQRLQNLLLTQKYHFNLPTTNLNFWKKTLPLIGPRIQTLSINTYDLTISLDFFSNLTSITISSQYFLLDGQLLSILNHQCFQQLHTFKIKNDVLHDKEILLKTIFSVNNKLQVFEYLPKLGGLFRQYLENLNSNIHMRSLTLNLDNFHDIFTLIQHIPNLIYLNIRSEMLDNEFEEYSWNSIGEIKLEEFHLAFTSRRNSEYSTISLTTDLDRLFHAIQIFSSSLIILSLDFSNICLTDRNSILTNGMELERKLLKPMQKLQNFYFYVGLLGCKDVEQILSTFATFPWPIGLHGNAELYSLPFSFHELKGFHQSRDVRSNNDEFLKQNDRLWSKVTSLNLVSIDRIDFKHLFPLIKHNMPKLSSITFYGGFCFHRFSFPDESGDSYDKIERINNVQLDSVTTVRLDHISIEQIEQIPMYSFPNIQCLLLNNTELPLEKNQLTLFLGQKLQRIESDEYSTQRNLKKQNLCYLSDIKHLRLAFGYLYCGKGLNSHPEIIRNLLIELPKLETLSIYVPRNGAYDEYGADPIYRPIMARLNENEIKAQYKIRYSGGAYMWIIKRTISSSSSFEDQYYSEFCISYDENGLH